MFDDNLCYPHLVFSPWETPQNSEEEKYKTQNALPSKSIISLRQINLPLDMKACTVLAHPV